ncbi:MAG: histidinol dehydrogenase [Candidatus Competibacteraceae bacterium]|nr:histidinol dehydrogenase [Candidatus Competibacteraceae bacterium]MCB1811836.1 histidinol dehydrogenase [Candidatus Competibacteraceae bacterium]
MPERIRLYELNQLSSQQRTQLLTRTEGDLSAFLAKVGPIIDAVRQDGDAALARFAQEFDKAPVQADQLAATAADFERAFAELEPDMIEVLEFAADNIRRFHEAQMPEEMWMKEIRPGVFTGERISPIESVACYVPRGKGSFPSVLLMTTIPAVVAGVPELIVVTPPGPDGNIDAATLVAARLAGVERVYKCGGAQAVAAVAFGTATIPKCRKIVGPGSPWVVAAKRLLVDHIDPGVPAGPSESIILADDTANPRIAALDLIIESEHGPDSSAFLVTSSRAVAEQARQAIPEYWAMMGEQRVEFSSAVLGGDKGGIVLTDTFDEAIQFVNDYAPEHLEIQSSEPFGYLGRIKNAGEVLLGEHTPVTLGNFVLGPNAVLPTSQAAFTASPLGVFDYLKRTSIGHVTSQGYAELAEKAHKFALYEGFDGHANAVSATRQQALKKS